MEPFSAIFRSVIQHLHDARVQHAAVTNSTSAEWFVNPDIAHPGTSLDAYILLEPADFPRAKAALQAAGMIHHAAEHVELFFDHTGAPIDSAVRISFPGKHVELRADASRKQVLDAELLEYLRKRETPVTITAREELDRLIATHLTPGLRTLGFRKHGRTFARQRGTLLQLIYFQGAWYSDRHTLHFDISLNIWSDRIAALHPFKETHPGPRYTLPKSGVPAENMCHWHGSLNLVFPKFAAVSFECHADSDNAEMATVVQDAIFNHAVPYFDPIDSEAALLNHWRRTTTNETLSQPRLFIAALIRLAGTLQDYDAFAKHLDHHLCSNDKVERMWSAAIRRMRKTRV